ncbi:hypothetical protein IP90_00495 [Luteimonas cucumeris]|uniref:Type IV pilus assembly protein PilN n=1 Tax=Luteimonas cucumeris TaxID=985012 RepID=A0A562LF47_9GAMM|nr:hypothetical protein [Luteimonas cucumeris]TWI06230.1 hypothetical protein IP90_00495 [Luteimonas cucumeris]
MALDRFALPARLRQSRHASLLLFAATLVLLLVAAAWFTSARSDLAEAYSHVGSRQQALTAANQRQQEAKLRVQLADSARSLVERASAGGFAENEWGERLINISQTPLARDEVNHLLAGMTRDHARIFGADVFELSVTRADEGLFDTPGSKGPPLMLNLRGTLLFRTAQSGSGVAAPVAALAAAPAIAPEAP